MPRGSVTRAPVSHYSSSISSSLKTGFDQLTRSITVCQEGGIATHCCATFVGGGGSCDAKWDSQSVSDLENVLAQQIKKTGQWSSTTVGKWYATYELLADDKVNPNVLSEWFHSISTFAGSTEAQEGIGGVDWIFFNYVADHTLSTIMVSYQC
jgi:hypothetical protein